MRHASGLGIENDSFGFSVSGGDLAFDFIGKLGEVAIQRFLTFQYNSLASVEPLNPPGKLSFEPLQVGVPLLQESHGLQKHLVL